MTTEAKQRPASQERSMLRSVAMPSEHGGWGLTLEPGVLGLAVAPSWAGLFVVAAAMLAFVARTPLRIVAVDYRRGRRLPRTRLAAKVAAVEVSAIALLAGAAVFAAPAWFWWPVVVVLPLLAVEASYEVRSRGRRLVTEVAGSIAVCSIAPMVVLAGGGSARVGVAAGLILAGRAVTSIPHVRSQIARFRHRSPVRWEALAGDVGAAALVIGAVFVDSAVLAGAVAVGIVVLIQRIGGLRPVPPPMVLGIRQMAMGLAVVVVTAVGIGLSG